MNAEGKSSPQLKGSTQIHNAVKKVVAYLLSTLGLIMVVIIYAVIGGFVFEWLESDNERLSKQRGRDIIHALTQQTAKRIYTTMQTSQYNMVKGSEDALLEHLENETWSYFHEIWELKKDGSWDGSYLDDGDVIQDWTFTGALLFSITTITTIGYGTITPVTTIGRITCIFYSMFGLPITMLCIASIGIRFAQKVRMIHKKLSAQCKKSVRNQVQEVPVLFSLFTMTAYIFLGTAIFCSWENWSVIKGAYFCFITLATIGFGDIVPGVYKGGESWRGDPSEKTFKLIVCGLYLFFGLALLAMFMDLMKEEVRSNFLWVGQKIGIGSFRKKKK